MYFLKLNIAKSVALNQFFSSTFVIFIDIRSNFRLKKWFI